MDRTRLEPVLRWTARVCGTLVAGFLYLSLSVGAVLTALDVELPATEETATTEERLAWYEIASLSVFAIGCFGFVVAWWRPIEGGAIAIAGVIPPFLTTLTSGGVLFLGIAVLGVFHVVDGVWRRQGIGPPIGAIRARRIDVSP